MPYTPPDHTPFAWEDQPSTTTPVDASNLQAAEDNVANYVQAVIEDYDTNYAPGAYIQSTDLAETPAPASAVIVNHAPYLTGRLRLRDRLAVGDFGMKFDGSDESSTFYTAVQTARTLGKALWLPEGQTVVSETLTDIADATNPLILRGAGKDKTIIKHEVESAPLFQLNGGGLTQVTTLASPLTSGLLVLPGLASTSGISAGDYLLLRDPNQALDGSGAEAGGSNNQAVALAGEWVRVFSVDSPSQITIYGYTNWALGANTQVLKLAYIDQSSFADFTVLNPFPRTNFSAARAFLLNYCVRPEFHRIAFKQLDAPGIYMQYTLDAKVVNCSFLDLEDDNGTQAARSNPSGGGGGGEGSVTTGQNPYGVVFGRACSHGLVTGCEQRNGRHLFTTTSSSTEVAPQHALVSNCIATEMFHAAFDCHPGARWISFVNCKVHNAAYDAFQIRSPDCDVINPIVTGARRGVSIPYGADRVRVSGGRLQNCQYGVYAISSNEVDIGGGLLIQDPAINGVLIDTPDADWSGHVTAGTIDNVRITGSPSDAAIRFASGAWADGFRLGRSILIPNTAKRILGATPWPSLASSPASAERRMVALRPTNVLWENVSRADLQTAAVSSADSGTLNIWRVYLPAGLPITQIGFVSGNTPASGPTHQWFSLYDYNLTPLGQTADDTSTAWAANTPKALTVTGGPFTTAYEGTYFVGLVVATSTTQPNFTGNVAPATTLGLVVSATTTNTGLTIPAAIAPTGVSERSGYPYIYFK